MGQGKELTESQRDQILLLRRVNSNWTNKQIAEAVGKSPDTVGRLLRSPNTYGRSKRSGRPKVTSEREDRAILKEATGSKKSSKEIKNDLNLTCTSRTIRNRLSKNPNVVYSRLKSKPDLKTIIS